MTELRMHDGFAGAGGSSTGAVEVKGVKVVVAMNHWQKAVDVHNANHPTTDHVCADISQYDPRRIPTAELGWFSPECTWHSQARGQKRLQSTPDLFGEVLPDEAGERSRATMWDVIRFTEVHRYQAVIVENVVDVRHWPPFRSWLLGMDSLGYEHHIVYLNSMHAQTNGMPAPQSRDRVYVVFWRKGNRRPDFEKMQRPRAYCPICCEIVESIQHWKNPAKVAGRYRQQYIYRCPKFSCKGQIVEPGWLPAAAAIDWSIIGKRIGDRERPLKLKTRNRITVGIARYWNESMQIETGNTYDATNPKHSQHGDPNAYHRIWPTSEPLRTLHTAESKALVVPVEGRDGKQPQWIDAPLRTMTTRAETALVTPFIAELRGGGSTARSVEQPMATVTAAGNHHGLVMPYYGASKSAKSTDEAIGTLTTVDRYALIMRNNTGGAEMSTPASEVMRTLTTAGHQSLITPGDMKAAEARVDDCLFRMLEPHEVAAGMAFPGDYIWEGTRRERVRMAGNAVTPPAARDLVTCVVESLEAA